MKKLITCFFWVLFCIPFAHAADGVGISRVLPTGNTTNAQSQRTHENTSDTSRGAAVRGATSENMPRATSSTASNAGPVARVGNRTVSVTSDARQASRVNASASSRGGGNSQSRASQKSDITSFDATNSSGRNARVEAASANSNPAVRRAGLSLRPTTAEVGGRAVIAGTDKQTGSNIGKDGQARKVSSRAATTQTAETIADAKTRLEQTADLNKSCQEQYNDCMDQFCAVVDANQKRCSCSSNLSQYAKVESAVKDANVKLNDVAQNIRYIGLSADEIRAIMSATEAEQAMSSNKDNTQTRNMLEEIEKLIKNPTSSSSSSSGGTSFGLDMDLDFSSEASDIFNLDFLSGSNSTISNMRGTQLYNMAKKRCKTVLNQCKKAGATEQQITGNYDLAIDKDCIAYEQGLNKMNESLLSNVRSANLMLQKARLALKQSKNEYDAKACIAALDKCMTDDMVCGSDYFKCLDPTKKYIDENGKVVLGQNINAITDFMEHYDNSGINEEYLQQSYNITRLDSCSTDGDGKCIVRYLLQKIGTGQKVTDEGLCRAVLDKCQNYTYDSGNKYKPYNDIVVNYIQRAMVNIKAAQYQIISDYATTCMTDVADCYNQQVTQVNSWTSSASSASVYSIMRGACRNVALTCAYAIFSEPERNAPGINAEACVYYSDSDNTVKESNPDKCIDKVSEIFNQSLLCPANSTHTGSVFTSPDRTIEGYVNTRCKCNPGYFSFGGKCVANCDVNEYVNSYGVCAACSSGSFNNITNSAKFPNDATCGGGREACYPIVLNHNGGSITTIDARAQGYTSSSPQYYTTPTVLYMHDVSNSDNWQWYTDPNCSNYLWFAKGQLPYSSTENAGGNEFPAPLLTDKKISGYYNEQGERLFGLCGDPRAYNVCPSATFTGPATLTAYWVDK